mgnify:FL=1
MSLFDASNPLWQRWAITLVHFLWQASAVALCVMLFMKMVRPRTANARYAAYLTGLLALAACPIVTFTLVDAPQQVLLMTDDAIAAAPSAPPSATSSLRYSVTPSLPAAASLSTWLAPYQPYILGVWLAGVALFSLRLFVAAVGVHRLRQSQTPVSPALVELADRLSLALRLRVTQRIAASHHIDDPAAIGLFPSGHVVALPARAHGARTVLR